MFLVCFWVYPSYTEIQQIWSYIDIEITCQKELLVTQKIIRTRRVQDTVNIWYVAARKVCLIVDSQVMIWSCTLSYKNFHQHFYAFNTIFVPFLQYLRSLSMNLILITLQQHFNLQDIKNYVPFPSSLKSIAYFSFFGVRNLKAVEGLFMFFLPNFDLLLFYLMERKASATYNKLQANWVVFGWFFVDKS